MSINCIACSYNFVLKRKIDLKSKEEEETEIYTYYFPISKCKKSVGNDSNYKCLNAKPTDSL